ncbi:hypothetical protein D9757_001070 [Collybiopsis confluens]|uniref:1-acyl-sn-glycerol-3-phosphate acyltransferase n=1 Tax=Collybiopsis confluens TaxID=2823264 RepID=A0A8H5I097_9AGAR|nr:hypothetical protein D9757_010463 [Collybiopsis confluens]KAF5392651.1 hypothetical protein D9757_001070 [Collybiopsis confluens]
MSFLLSLFRPLAYISLPVILARTISSSSPTGQYYVRRGLYIGCMTAIATWGIVVAATMSVAGHRYDVNWVIARAFYALAGNVLGISVEVEGEEHLLTKPGVILSNHQSMLDVLFVGKLMPKRTSIMAKKSLQYTPLGPFMLMSGAVFIDRGNNARAVRSLDAAGQLMKARKISLWMYPEGTRNLSQEPDMLPFKKGAFHLAVQSGIPIVPIVTENYWRIYREGVFGRGLIKVREGMTVDDVPELTKRVRDLMMSALRDLSVKVTELELSASSERRITAAGVSHATHVRDVEGEIHENEEDGLRQENLNSRSETLQGSAEPSNASTSITSTQQVPTEGVTEPDQDAGLFSAPDVNVSNAEDNGTALDTRRRTDSSVSLASSSNGTGTETEEDEGMVIVGRPT